LATTTLHPAPLRDAGRTALARVAAGLAAIGRFIGDVSRARRCAAEVDRLMMLSDAELGRRGLARGEVVAYAFRKHMGD
jgi:hypothetical protein